MSATTSSLDYEACTKFKKFSIFGNLMGRVKFGEMTPSEIWEFVVFVGAFFRRRHIGRSARWHNWRVFFTTYTYCISDHSKPSESSAMDVGIGRCSVPRCFGQSEVRMRRLFIVNARSRRGATRPRMNRRSGEAVNCPGPYSRSACGLRACLV